MRIIPEYGSRDFSFFFCKLIREIRENHDIPYHIKCIWHEGKLFRIQHILQEILKVFFHATGNPPALSGRCPSALWLTALCWHPPSPGRIHGSPPIAARWHQHLHCPT